MAARYTASALMQGLTISVPGESRWSLTPALARRPLRRYLRQCVERGVALSSRGHAVFGNDAINGEACCAGRRDGAAMRECSPRDRSRHGPGHNILDAPSINRSTCTNRACLACPCAPDPPRPSPAVAGQWRRLFDIQCAAPSFRRTDASSPFWGILWPSTRYSVSRTVQILKIDHHEPPYRIYDMRILFEGIFKIRPDVQPTEERP